MRRHTLIVGVLLLTVAGAATQSQAPVYPALIPLSAGWETSPVRRVTDKDLTQNSWIRAKCSPHVKSGTVPDCNSFRPKACRQRKEFWINWRLALRCRTSNRDEEHADDESMSPHVNSL